MCVKVVLFWLYGIKKGAHEIVDCDFIKISIMCCIYTYTFAVDKQIPHIELELPIFHNTNRKTNNNSNVCVCLRSASVYRVFFASFGIRKNKFPKKWNDCRQRLKNGYQNGNMLCILERSNHRSTKSTLYTLRKHVWYPSLWYESLKCGRNSCELILEIFLNTEDK